MGVHGLWQLLTPVGRPVMLETMEGKSMAIDSSIWLYQFQATMRDKEGRALVNAHVLGFLRRITKLLFYGIRPVFVFDGGAPVIKRNTLTGRKRKKEGAKESHVRVAERLLAAQMRREALNRVSERKNKKGKEKDEETVFLEDIDSSVPKAPPRPPAEQKASPKKNKWADYDPYRLPDIDMSMLSASANSRSNPDPRLATEDELRTFIEEMRPEDFDVSSEAFKELPTEVQYEIIGDLRLKSRQTSYSRLQNMLRTSRTPLDFSKQQIAGLKQRNSLTQQLLTTTDDIGKAHISIPVRIASERNKEYVLVKNESESGGWILGIQDTGGTSKEQPIKIDVEESESEDEEDEDMEEVQIEPDFSSDPPEVEMDLDLRAYNRKMALSAIAKRYTPKKLAPLSTKSPSTSKSKPVPLFVADSEDEEQHHSPSPEKDDEEDEDNEDLALAIQASLDQTREEEPAIFVEDSRLGTALSIAGAGPSRGFAGFGPGFGLSPEKAGPSRIPTFGKPSNLLRTTSATKTTSKTSAVIDDDDESDEDMEVVEVPAPRPVSSLTAESSLQKTSETHNNLSRTERPALSPSPQPLVMRDVPANGGGFIENDSADTRFSRITEAIMDNRDEVSSNTAANAIAVPSTLGIISDSASAPEIPEPVAPSSPDSFPTVTATKPSLIDSATQPMPNTYSWAEGEAGPSNIYVPTSSLGQEDVTLAEEAASLYEPPAPVDMAMESEISFDQANKSTETDPDPTDENEDKPVEYDAANEIDPSAEHTEFARFVSQMKGRDLDSAREEIDDEIRDLHQQRKVAMRDEEGGDVGASGIQAIMTMLRLFGIPYITAPMEAEAQCAFLSSIGLVDGVITDDSDVFLFDCPRVFKNMFNQSKTVMCFLSTDLSRELGLDRDTLVRLSYLLGSDYTDGLPGVGPVGAMEVLKEFPGEAGLHKFREWWGKVQSGRDKGNDTGSNFKQRFKKKFKDLYLQPDWPNPAVRDAYYHPNVDTSDEPFKWGLPDLDGLRDFLQSELGWKQEKTDELLLPIIRKVTKRNQDKALNKQGNLNEFFDISLGSGTAAPKQREPFASKRLAKVVAEYRKSKKNGTPGPGEDDDDGKEEGDERPTKRPRKAVKATGKKRTIKATSRKKGRGKKATQVDKEEEEHENADANEDGEGSGDEYRANNSTLEDVRASEVKLRPRPKAKPAYKGASQDLDEG